MPPLPKSDYIFSTEQEGRRRRTTVFERNQTGTDRYTIPSPLLVSPALANLRHEKENNDRADVRRLVAPRNTDEFRRIVTEERANRTTKRRKTASKTKKKTTATATSKVVRGVKRSAKQVLLFRRDPTIARGSGGGIYRPMPGKRSKKASAGSPRGGNSNSNSSSSSSSSSSNRFAPTANDPRPSPKKVSPSRAQTDIRKLLDALSEYAYENKNGSSGCSSCSSNANEIHKASDISSSTTTGSRIVPDEDPSDAAASGSALPPLIAQIPKTLVGFVGTHCELDVVAVSNAARGILDFSSSSVENPRSSLLRDEFRRVFRTGGTEIVLQGIARMTQKCLRPKKPTTAIAGGIFATPSAPSPSEPEASTEAVVLSWGIVSAGIASGLSTHTLVLIARSCILAMNDLETAWNETGGSGSGKLLLDTLGKILSVLSEALRSPRLTADDLYYDQTTILASCLALLGQACCCSDGDDDPEAEAAIIGLLEELLGILVVCARKGLIRGHDFQRLVPACQASLSRFQLATANIACVDEGEGDAPTPRSTGLGETIVVRVVELIELEDKTVGLWLRHTYGIATAAEGGEEPPGRIREAAEAAYESAESTIGGRRYPDPEDEDQQQQRQRQHQSQPSPPQRRELFPSVALGPAGRHLDREDGDESD